MAARWEGVVRNATTKLHMSRILTGEETIVERGGNGADFNNDLIGRGVFYNSP